MQTKCIICGSDTEKIDDSQINVIHDYCPNCGFIYKGKEYHLEMHNEHEQYILHNNTMENEGYVNIFLDLISEYIKPLGVMRKVLEFGSGPGPVLKALLKREGYDVCDFDPFFNDNTEYLNNKYQLITSTEVIEHFSDPLKEFKHLYNLLEKDGYLLIMTRLRKMGIEEFLNWWYRRDLTHISFYTMGTIEYIARKLNMKIMKTNNENIILLQKN